MIYRARAPLRLGLAGGGTDVSPYCESHGGAILNATIDLYAYAFLEIDERLGNPSFHALDFGISETAPVAGSVDYPSTLPLHVAVYQRIVRDFRNGSPLPCKLTTYCEAPPGSGLGSSSTLVVAMIRAFAEALSLPLGEYDLAHLAFEIERKDARLMGGRQDQYAAAFGGVNFMEFYADDRVIVNPLRIKSSTLAELESSLVLFHTGVSRQSAQIIAEQSANLVAGSEQTLSAMHELKKDAYLMKEALLKGEIRRVAEILGNSWQSKRRLASRISNQRIDELIERALAAGARAAKISGAGGGGFATFIVDPLRRLDLLRTLEKEDGRVLPCSLTKRGAEAWRFDA